ncbi:hypothetical protein L1887_18044 [Cichorium endivia]|nr:hypothetical protein L1887_18044 [Cichorium endivia]
MKKASTLKSFVSKEDGPYLRMEGFIILETDTSKPPLGLFHKYPLFPKVLYEPNAASCRPPTVQTADVSNVLGVSFFTFLPKKSLITMFITCAMFFLWIELFSYQPVDKKRNK